MGRIPLRCASYDEPTVYWPWTRRVGISLVQLTLILGLIKCSFCDNTDMVILIRWFYHPKFCFEYYTRIFHLVRRDFDVVAVDGTHDWP
ncbi:hypothetical protein DERF_010983 [Dermatophagoides farinae]|uniref:Uncharacterized protein n=1 Tax=Dermatophagoides farinae TaxID=6954 RepID=A0A922HRC9_DERFA|nr:hypothetical protein DERF_010983 [Dermatophagoides farinae]